MCFAKHCNSATDFAGYVLRVDTQLFKNRSPRRAHDFIMTLAGMYDAGIGSFDAATRLDQKYAPEKEKWRKNWSAT